MKLIVANWKMHKTQKQSLQFARKVKNIGKRNKVILCPPYTDLCPLAPLIKKSKIQLGAQDVFYELKGAFTGEISPLMLKELNVTYVIVGHSERRNILKESDNIINKKLRACLKNNLTPILCIGENKHQRTFGQTQHFLRKQIINALKGVKKQKIKDIIIAYEPLWAIGSGKPDTPEDANRTHKFIRSVIKLLDRNAAQHISILYGRKHQHKERIFIPQTRKHKWCTHWKRFIKSNSF